MPELRKDPVVGRWVIISSDRGRRPTDFNGSAPPPSGKPCPFCVGNEDKTPPEILAYREAGTSPNTPGWSTRVVPNKFPALQIEGGLDRRGEGLYDKMNGIGAHEVIIETPDHDATLATMPPKAVEDVLWAYRDRIMDLKRDLRFRYVLIFKNHGISAGATLEHSHSQLIALPIVPKRVREEVDGSLTYFRYKERCIFCDIVRQELDAGVRVVGENSEFVAIAPFAPRFPFETWLLPKRHDSSFEDASPKQFVALATMLQETLRRLDAVLESPAYNYVLHTSPFREEDNEYYHWHIEIIPKLTKVAGFEWGSGFFINPTPPEEAARFLREARIERVQEGAR